MMPVKSISQLSGFNLQDESLIPFEQVVLDSSLAVNRYSVSSDNAKYNNLFAGDLEDGDLYLEVSYKDKTTGNYVPRKFDFSNYLRYVENALSILNNGIMGVYLTRAQADELYVSLTGDTMTGPLAITLGETAGSLSPPLKIEDNRTGDLTYNGMIEIHGRKTEIVLYNDSTVGAKISGKPSGSDQLLFIKDVLEVNSDKVTISKNLIASNDVSTPHISDIRDGILTLSDTNITSELSSADGIKIIGTPTSPHGIRIQNGDIKVTSGQLEATGITVQTASIAHSLTMASILTANSTNLNVDVPLSANNGLLTKNLLVYDEAESERTILIANGTSIEFHRPAKSHKSFTSENGGITIKNTGNNLTLENGNVVMSGSSKIIFGEKYISYSSAKSAFEITNLYVPTTLEVGTGSGTDASTVSVTTSPPTTAPLMVGGDIVCSHTLFSSQAIKASKIVTPNFESGTITATTKFVQPTGIAELTAKRACWA